MTVSLQFYDSATVGGEAGSSGTAISLRVQGSAGHPNKKEDTHVRDIIYSDSAARWGWDRPACSGKPIAYRAFEISGNERLPSLIGRCPPGVRLRHGRDTVKSASELSAQFFREHHKTVRRYASRHVPADDVDDVVQETFTAVHKQLLNEYEVRTPLGYLLTAAAKVVQAFFSRSFGSYVPWKDDADEGVNHSFSAEDEVIQLENLETILAIVEELPPKRSEVFILVRFYGLSAKEVAALRGINIQTVKDHLRKSNVVIRRVREARRANGKANGAAPQESEKDKVGHNGAQR